MQKVDAGAIHGIILCTGMKPESKSVITLQPLEEANENFLAHQSCTGKREDDLRDLRNGGIFGVFPNFWRLIATRKKEYSHHITSFHHANSS